MANKALNIKHGILDDLKSTSQSDGTLYVAKKDGSKAEFYADLDNVRYIISDGSVINDTTTSSVDTWSSQQISSAILATKNAIETFLVTVNKVSGGYSANKLFSDILTAFNHKKSIFCIVIDEDLSIVAPLVAINENVAIFSFSMENDTGSVTIRSTNVVEVEIFETVLTENFDNHYHTATYTPKGVNSEASITPAGSISSSFTGTEFSHNHSFTGTAASHNHTFTGTENTVSTKYTPAGTNSTPVFTGTSAKSGNPNETEVSVYSITGVGSIASLGLSVDKKCLTLTFGGGSLPTRTEVKVPSESHTHNVTATGNVSKPTFTGSEATISASYIPAGTISNTSITPSGGISTKVITPSGSVSSTFTGTAVKHNHTFTGTGATITSGQPKNN